MGRDIICTLVDFKRNKDTSLMMTYKLQFNSDYSALVIDDYDFVHVDTIGEVNFNVRFEDIDNVKIPTREEYFKLLDYFNGLKKN